LTQNNYLRKEVIKMKVYIVVGVQNSNIVISDYGVKRTLKEAQEELENIKKEVSEPYHLIDNGFELDDYEEYYVIKESYLEEEKENVK
jgi:hypothetical protein